MEDRSDLTLAILEKDDAEFLGVCGLHGQFSPAESCLGIWLKKGAHGHRDGREAIVAGVGWARQNVIFNCLVYPCDKAISPAGKLPRACMVPRSGPMP
jgi:RimJ/RimL family protein N-acetyltransferase